MPTCFKKSLIIFFTILSTTVCAQEFIINSQFYGVKEGLSHRDVQCIHQDKQGFLWFGTKYGLNRFDGYRFQWFTQEKNRLQSNEINHILEDGQEQMWLIQTGGFLSKTIKTIDIFNPQTHKVQPFAEVFNTAPFSVNEVLSFNHNHKGHLIFLTPDKLITYDGAFKFLPVDLEESSYITNIHWINDGRFIIISEQKKLNQSVLYILDKNGKISHQYKHPSSVYLNVYEIAENGSFKYTDYTHEAQKGHSLISFYDINSTGEQIQDTSAIRFFSGHKFTRADAVSFLHKHQNYYWTYGSDKQFQLLPIDNSDPVLLSNKYPELKSTTAILPDKNGAIWISTQFGVYRFKLQSPLFRNFFHNESNTTTAEHLACRGLEYTYSPKEQLWVMVENKVGLMSADKSNYSGDHAFITRNTRQALSKDAAGNLLFYYDGISIFSPQSKRITKKLNCKLNNEPLLIWTIYEDKYGKIWLDNLTYGDLRYISDGKLTVLKNWGSDMKGHIAYQFYEEESDTAWVVTTGGLFTMDIRDGRVINRYWKEGQNLFHLPYDNINHLYKDSSGIFWLGTANTGLLKWHPKSGIIKRFTRADGLPHNTIYAIYEDDYGNLWMSTDNGIAVFNKKTQQIRGYTETDGICHNEFNRTSHLQDKAGNIYFGSLNGVTAFHPKDFFENNSFFHPPMAIVKFQQFDGELDQLIDNTAALRKTNSFTLHPTDRFFLIEFALLTYEDAELTQYAYKIEGVDNHWTYQSENILRLSRLPYGSHTIHIKGQAPNGLWSEKELAIQVVVLKPFYLKTWFLVLSIFSILAAVFIFYKRRTVQLTKQKRELEKEVARRTETIRQQAEEIKSLEKLKSRFFANVSHELRTPLTLITGPVNKLLKNKTRDEQEWQLLRFIQRHSHQLLTLINEILDFSKLESGKLKVEEVPVDLYFFLKNLITQFHSDASNESSRFSIEYYASQQLTFLLDKEKVKKVIQNYLSNAIKHSPPEAPIILSVYEKEEYIKLSVKDSGTGIHPNDLPYVFDRFYQSQQMNGYNKNGTGIGLSLCKELAGLMGGTAWAESEVGTGSIFHLKLPKKITTRISSVFDTDIEKSKDTEVASPPKAKNQASTDDQSQINILLVEDNIDLQKYIKILLPQYHIITAGNGADAVQLLETSTSSLLPSLIISDLMMPIMDGLELLEKVKSDDRWRHIPTIMLTAKVNAKTKLQALRIGIDDYLTKPFQEEELVARIENLLSNHAQRIKLFSHNTASENSTENRPLMTQVDAEWLKKVEETFKQYLSDDRLKISFAANQLLISERQFHRRLKQLTGMTPNKYLQEIRLQTARDYLSEGKYSTIKEIAAAVGFTTTRYFSQLFKQRFGVRPTDFQS